MFLVFDHSHKIKYFLPVDLVTGLFIVFLAKASDEIHSLLSATVSYFKLNIFWECVLKFASCFENFPVYFKISGAMYVYALGLYI